MTAFETCNKIFLSYTPLQISVFQILYVGGCQYQRFVTDKYFVQISHSMQIPCKVGGTRRCQLRANHRASKLSLVHTRVGICQCILFFQKLFFSEWQIRVLNSSLQASETSDLTTEPTRHTCIDCVVNYKSCNSSDKVSNHSEDNNLNFISINLKYN